jgi:hypothetical protein
MHHNDLHATHSKSHSRIITSPGNECRPYGVAGRGHLFLGRFMAHPSDVEYTRFGLCATRGPSDLWTDSLTTTQRLGVWPGSLWKWDGLRHDLSSRSNTWAEAASRSASPDKMHHLKHDVAGLKGADFKVRP